MSSGYSFERGGLGTNKVMTLVVVFSAAIKDLRAFGTGHGTSLWERAQQGEEGIE